MVSKIAPKLLPSRVQNGAKKQCQKQAKMMPTWVLEATWGGPKSAQAAFGLLEASWKALGGLLDQKEVLLIGSWRLLEKFQDSFQRS